MNRQQRRASSKSQMKKPIWHGLTKEQKKEALFKNGITIDDLKKEFDNGYKAGFADAAPQTFKTIYAAICLTLNEKYGFGKKRCLDVLNSVDSLVINTLNSYEAIEDVYNKIGLKINFDETFERVEEI